MFTVHGHISGDSIQNIVGDVLSCAVGYILGTLFLAVELWWLSIVWILVSEVGTLYSKKYRLVTCVLINVDNSITNSLDPPQAKLCYFLV